MPRSVEQMDPIAFVDGAFDKMALPEPGEVLNEVAPKTVFRRLGVESLDDLSDELLAEVRQDLRE